MSARRSISSSLLACLCASSAAYSEPARIGELAIRHGGMVEYLVQVEPDKNGNRTVQADIDEDGADDVLRWSDPGTASMLPADDSTLTLTLTSNKKSFTLQQQRLYVVKFESRYYVVTTRAETQLGPWYREVFGLARDGITNVCSVEGKGQVP